MDRAPKLIVLILLTLSFFWTTPVFSSEAKNEEEKEGSFSIEGVEVIQNRLFQKRGRHELSAGFGLLYDNNFVFYEMFPLRYTYFLSESIAFEASVAFFLAQEKSIVGSLQNEFGVDVQVEKIKRYYTGAFVWSPVYGKFNIFASLILHFDFYLTGGLGMLDNVVTQDNVGVQHMTYIFGAGLRTYLNDWLALRIDFRNYTWKEGEPFNDIVNNRIISFGLGFFLPTHNLER